MANSEDEEDDYMSMAIAEPTQPKFETSVQKRARQKREAESRSHHKSKAEIAADEAAAREASLAKQIDASSKGFKMLSKLGYTPGTALGAQDRIDARLEPIGIEMKEGRSGIGLDAEKKRKFREENAENVKRVKASEEDYRVRVAKEREEKRNEGLWKAAMNVLEGMVEESAEDEQGHDGGDVGQHAGDEDSRHANAIGVGTKPKPKSSKPLPAVNLLYRSLVRQRLLAERERRMRYDLVQSLSQNPSYADDPEESAGETEVVDDAELEDPDLDEYEALDPAVRLEKVLDFLRGRYHYCFWCKSRYPDTAMEGCPGLLEDDHD